MQIYVCSNLQGILGVGDLAVQCRGEFLEMPGMRLTLRQAARLWNTDVVTCEGTLEGLVTSGFLRKVGQSYMRADSGRGHA